MSKRKWTDMKQYEEVILRMVSEGGTRKLIADELGLESKQIKNFLYIQRSGVKLIHQEGDRAFYRPSSDSVILPLLSQFENAAEYYSTAFHELTHSTGHSNRLDRLSKTAFFGSEAYSKKEIVAELGASALVNHCGIETSSSFRNNVAYIQNWLQALRNDKRLIVSASGKAEKAVDWILNSQH